MIDAKPTVELYFLRAVLGTKQIETNSNWNKYKHEYNEKI